MGILSLFKGDTENIDLSSKSFHKCLTTHEVELAHCTNISKKIQTRKKNYYKIAFDDLNKNSDIAMYVAPQFHGTKPTSLETTVRYFAGFNRRSDYPLYLKKSNASNVFLYTDLELIRTNCRDIHMELDEKEGKLCTKYIIHCADNEDDYDIYFVFYNADLKQKFINAMMNPSWRITE